VHKALPNTDRLLTNPVQEANKKGASASDWANAVSGVVGGKAGGKAPTSIGSGTNVDKVDQAVAVATKYLEGLHL